MGLTKAAPSGAKQRRHYAALSDPMRGPTGGGPLLAGEIGPESIQNPALRSADRLCQAAVAAQETPRLVVHLRGVSAGARKLRARDDIR